LAMSACALVSFAAFSLLALAGGMARGPEVPHVSGWWAQGPKQGRVVVEFTYTDRAAQDPAVRPADWTEPVTSADPPLLGDLQLSPPLRSAGPWAERGYPLSAWLDRPARHAAARVALKVVADSLELTPPPVSPSPSFRSGGLLGALESEQPDLFGEQLYLP